MSNRRLASMLMKSSKHSKMTPKGMGKVLFVVIVLAIMFGILIWEVHEDNVSQQNYYNQLFPPNSQS
jgi:cytoskeletal protein RodZ